MSDIILSAGVRQNLLSLQNTAALMSTTQYRLATGKKVNTALDNPANYFTSQSLNNRASDLNALLDSIGQAQQSLSATDTGLTSLTKLVQSAKSIAEQARQSSNPPNTYGAVTVSGSVAGTETLGSVLGADLSPKPIALSFTNQAETLGTVSGGTFANDAAVGAATTGNTGTDKVRITLTDHGGATKTFDVVVANSITTKAGLLAAFANTTSGTPGDTLDQYLNIGYNTNTLSLTAKTSAVDFSIAPSGAGTTAAGLTATGLGAGAYNSTSLLDNIVAAGGTIGDTLNLTVNGGPPNTITFDHSHVETLADLNTFIANSGGQVTGSASGTTFALNLASGTGKSLGLAASSAAVKTALGLNTAITAVNLGSGGSRGGLGTSSTALSRTYNSDVTLAEIDPTNLSSGGNLTINIDKNDGNGVQSQVIGLAATDNLATIASKLLGNATVNNTINISTLGGKLALSSKNSDYDFTVKGSFAGTALGTNTNSSTDNTGGTSTSLLDNLVTSGGAPGQQLTIKANNGITQTITFGTGSGQISTSAELQTALGNLNAVTATLAGSALTIGVPAGSTATSIAIGGDALVLAQLGLSAGTSNGTFTAGTPDATRASLQNDFNDVLDQIDQLVKDTSYKGINLLNGDDLKVVFNEQGTSFLNIQGVTFNSAGLGLATINGTGFQSNTTIDATISSIDTALSTLRTQASKFGSNLTTVQVRQDFTKSLISTLQTGADNLVLADSNEEGANMLALQTRQQLSTTALSLANQASQAVLRLFG